MDFFFSSDAEDNGERSPEELVRVLVEHPDPSISSWCKTHFSAWQKDQYLEMLIESFSIADKIHALDEVLIIEVMQRILDFGADAIPALMQALNTSQGLKKQTVINALGELEVKAAIPNILLALKDAYPSVRAAAAEFLKDLDVHSARPDLLPLLKDQLPGVRYHAAQALGRIGDENNVPDLETLLQDSDLRVKIAAIESLGQFKSPHSVAKLIPCLQDADAGVRKATIQALGMIASPEVIPFLVALLADPDIPVLTKAIEVLGDLKAPEAIPALHSLLHHPDQNVQLEAADALLTLQPEQAIAFLLEAHLPMPDLMKEDPDALGEYPGMLRDLAQLLETENVTETLTAEQTAQLQHVLTLQEKRDLLLHNLCLSYNLAPRDLLVQNLSQVFGLVSEREGKLFLNRAALQVLKQPQAFLEHWQRLSADAPPGQICPAIQTDRDSQWLQIQILEEKESAYLACLQYLTHPQLQLIAARGLNFLQDTRSRPALLAQLQDCPSEVLLELAQALCKLGFSEDAETLYPLLFDRLKAEITGTETQAFQALLNLEQESRLNAGPELHRDDTRPDPEDLAEAQILTHLYNLEEPLIELVSLQDQALELFLEHLSWNPHYWHTPPLLALQTSLSQNLYHGGWARLAQFNDLLPELPLLEQSLSGPDLRLSHQVLKAHWGDRQIYLQLLETDLLHLSPREQEALCRLYFKKPEALTFLRQLLDLDDRPAKLLALRYFQPQGLRWQETDQIWQNLASDDSDLIQASLHFLARTSDNPKALRIEDPNRLHLLLNSLESWDAERELACPFHSLLENLNLPSELFHSEKKRILQLLQKESLCPSVRKGLLKCLNHFAPEQISHLLPGLLETPAYSLRKQALNLEPKLFHTDLLPKLQKIALNDSAELRLRALKLIKHLAPQKAIWVAEREGQECTLVRQGLDYLYVGHRSHLPDF
ncbi:MAG: HEAT repeat domain-containing protein [Candidatus Sericytochromatia bacterium]|nr:HEAT repeat domain-containing protein [Candidatus Sericytochromatia bacterium]